LSGVLVVVLHPTDDDHAGPLARWLTAIRADLAERQRVGFERVAHGLSGPRGVRDPGAALVDARVEVRVEAGRPDGRPFGARLRDIVATDRPEGIVILGSGALALATDRDRRRFVEAATSTAETALANNRFSADAIAIARVDRLPVIPDLPTDNELPRWLDEVAGFDVADLRHRWRLAVDLDSPLDTVLTGLDHAKSHLDDGERTSGELIDRSAIDDRLAAIRTVAADRRAELLVAGRTSARSIAWLEDHAAARVRALVEERGLRAAGRLAQAEPGSVNAADVPGQHVHGRPPASILGALLEGDGPGSVGRIVARLADAALIDTRVLLAHRLGPDESAWPSPEDRFASDLLLHERIADPWLRELTRSAATAAIPIALGGHTLVGPGIRLVLRPRQDR
jgi:hypothetical protein